MSSIQDIFHKFYAPYRERYTPSMQQAKAAGDIMRCRTAILGGHVNECKECGHTVVRYNSCRNRHCPLCQGVNKAVWVDKRTSDILNAPYFHVVFTVPQELHPLIYQNQELLYGLMYKAVAETLSELSQDKKYLGAQIGFFSLLHTWGQDLHYLKQYYQQNLLKFYGVAEQYCDPKKFRQLLNQCYEKDWYTYTKKTFLGPLAVVQYLGRYTHRIAISNTRIVSMDEDTVTITVKDTKDRSKKRNLTLKGVEFVRRFLMHILPKGFVKIRHYGILANRNKKTKLELSRKLTLSPTYKPKFEGLKTLEILCILVGKDVMVCPACKKGKLQEKYSLPPGASP